MTNYNDFIEVSAEEFYGDFNRDEAIQEMNQEMNQENFKKIEAYEKSFKLQEYNNRQNFGRCYLPDEYEF